jgi:hypothetical protein
MRVSLKRSIAGQKGGIGSALARMKLENASRSRSQPSRAIAARASAEASANADHSHSHQSLLEAQPLSEDSGKQRGQRPAIAVSSELAAYVAKRTT